MILLNGPSSAGKSGIGRALLPLLEGPWFLVPVDAIGAMRSTVATAVLEGEALREVLLRTRRGYHRAVAGLASAGNDVVMDYPLSEPWRVDDLVDVLNGFDVVLVDVWCSPAELDRRECGRGDRPVGLAGSQTGVFAHADRDVTVDTTTASAEQCAAWIVEAIPTVTRPTAFDRLRSARAHRTPPS